VGAQDLDGLADVGLEEGRRVGKTTGSAEGSSVGGTEGSRVGRTVRRKLGTRLGRMIGLREGVEEVGSAVDRDGCREDGLAVPASGWALLGGAEGKPVVGNGVGEKVGSSVGAIEGQDCVSVFTPLKAEGDTPGKPGPEPSTHTTEELWAKALLPMRTTLLGMMMVCREVQFKKELLAMRVTVLGMSRTVKREQSRRAG